MNIYEQLMNSKANPLRAFPPAQRLQTMIVLSVMWSTIFCAATTSWIWYGALVIGHVLFLLGIVMTAFIFNSASDKK